MRVAQKPPLSLSTRSLGVNPLHSVMKELLQKSLKISVSYVEGIEEIFVQSRIFWNHEKQLIEHCEIQGKVAVPVDEVVVGQTYLVNVLSKFDQNRHFYRGRITEQRNDKKFNGRLIDYGRPIYKLEADKIYPLSQQLLNEFPEGATGCSLYNLRALNDSKLIRRLISDFINRYV